MGIAAASLSAGYGQPAINSSDLFNQPGQYYRAYANRYNPLDITGGSAFVVPSNLIGSAGPNQFWDFSKGPTNRVFRFDYIVPTGLPEAVDFPAAAVAEKKTDESDGSVEYLFFTQIPAQGRKVYGFYGNTPNFTPSNVFLPPIVDFPDRIFYGQEWTTATTVVTEFNLFDPDPEEGGAFNLAAQLTFTSKFKVDAWGTIVLPDELGAFGEGLRVNEEVTIDVGVDLGEGTFDHLETDFTRNYYWMMPGYGIVAQLNSTQFSSPAPENFPRATAFLRLFETNKRITPGGGCIDPAPVTDLRIRVSAGNILLTWSRVECATQYRVEYATRHGTPGAWTTLGEPTTSTFWQGENTRGDTMRFYRVVSLK